MDSSHADSAAINLDGTDDTDRVGLDGSRRLARALADLLEHAHHQLAERGGSSPTSRLVEGHLGVTLDAAVVVSTDVPTWQHVSADRGAAAYLAQAPKIKSTDVLAAALSIHSVEARHAAALNALVGRGFTGSNGLEGSIPDGAFGAPMEMDAVLKAVKPFLA